MGISKRHLERLFKAWAGISPKQFGQYMRLQYAKQVLKEVNTLQAATRSGLSSQGRLHDLFVTIEAMTPGEFKQQGAGLSIAYSFTQSPFGLCLIASTPRGICAVLFCNTKKEGTKDLRRRFPHAVFTETRQTLHGVVADFLAGIKPKRPITLHLHGTNFQVKVWEALLSTPEGTLTTYSALAQRIKKPNAARAVGTAIGENPIGYLIPCHRVLRASGEIGGYHWGIERKQTMIAFEALRKNES